MEIQEIKKYTHKIVKINVANKNKFSSEDYVTVKIHLEKQANETIRFSLTKNPSGLEWLQHQSLGNDYFLRIKNKIDSITEIYAHFFPSSLYDYIESNEIYSMYDFSDLTKETRTNKWDGMEYPLQISSYGYEMLLGYDNKPLIRSLLNGSITRYKDPNYKNYIKTDIEKDISDMTEKGRFPLSSRYRNSLYMTAPNLNDKENFSLPYWKAHTPQYSYGAVPKEVASIDQQTIKKIWNDAYKCKYIIEEMKKESSTTDPQEANEYYTQCVEDKGYTVFNSYGLSSFLYYRFNAEGIRCKIVGDNSHHYVMIDTGDGYKYPYEYNNMDAKYRKLTNSSSQTILDTYIPIYGYTYNDNTATNEYVNKYGDENPCKKRDTLIPYWEAKIHRSGINPWIHDTLGDMDNYEPINVYLNYQYLPTSTEYHQHYFGFEKKNIKDQNGEQPEAMLTAVESYRPNGTYDAEQTAANKKILEEYCEKINNGTYKQLTKNDTYEVLDGEELNDINQAFGEDDVTYRIIRHGNPFDDSSNVYVNHKNIYDINLDTVGIIENCLWEKNQCDNYYTYIPTGEGAAYVNVNLKPDTYYVLKYFMYIPADAYIEDDSCYIEIQCYDDDGNIRKSELDKAFKAQDKKLRHQWIYHEIPFYTYNSVNKIVIKGPQHNSENIVGIDRLTGKIKEDYSDIDIIPLIDEVVAEHVNTLIIDLSNNIKEEDELISAFENINENILNTVMSKIEENNIEIEEEIVAQIVDSFLIQTLNNITLSLNNESIIQAINGTIIELIYKYTNDINIELHDCKNDIIHFYSIQIAEMVEYSPIIKYTKTGVYVIEENEYAKKSLTDTKETECVLGENAENQWMNDEKLNSTDTWINKGNTKLPTPLTDVHILFDDDFDIIYNKLTTELTYTEGDYPFTFDKFNEIFDERFSWTSDDSEICLEYDRITTPESNAETDQQHDNRDENDLDINQPFIGELHLFNNKKKVFTTGINNTLLMRLQDSYGVPISTGEVECSIWTSNKEENTPCNEAELCLGTQKPDEFGTVIYEHLNFKNFKSTNTYYLRVKYYNNCYNREITKWRTLNFVEERRNMTVYVNRCDPRDTGKLIMETGIEDIYLDNNGVLVFDKIEEATEITTQQELIKDLSLVDEDLKAEITWASTPNHLVDIVTNISWDSNNDIIVEKDNGYENHVCLKEDKCCKQVSKSIFENISNKYKKWSTIYSIESVDEYPLRLDVKIRSQPLDNDEGNIINEGYCELSVNDKVVQTTFVDRNGIADFYLDEGDLDSGTQTVKIEYFTRPNEPINYTYFEIQCKGEYDERKAIPININKITQDSVTQLASGIYEIEKDDIFFADIDANGYTNFSITVNKNGISEFENVIETCNKHIAAMYEGNDIDTYTISTGNLKDSTGKKDTNNLYRTTKKNFIVKWVPVRPRIIKVTGIDDISIDEKGDIVTNMLMEYPLNPSEEELELIKDISISDKGAISATTILIKKESDLDNVITNMDFDDNKDITVE